MDTSVTAFAAYFYDLEDPRKSRGQLHLFFDILMIAICAVICGADSWVRVETFGNAKAKWFHTILKLPNGSPLMIRTGAYSCSWTKMPLVFASPIGYKVLSRLHLDRSLPLTVRQSALHMANPSLPREEAKKHRSFPALRVPGIWQQPACTKDH
jgi:hypothetical protein